MAVKKPRPVTRALMIARGAAPFRGMYFMLPTQRNELVRLLTRMDASTGKPDTARKKRARKIRR